jgi:hypothetical protein
MGSYDMSGLVKLAVLGLFTAVFIIGGIAGFAAATIINLGKLCL